MSRTPDYSIEQLRYQQEALSLSLRLSVEGYITHFGNTKETRRNAKTAMEIACELIKDELS